MSLTDESSGEFGSIGILKVISSENLISRFVSGFTTLVSSTDIADSIYLIFAYQVVDFSLASGFHNIAVCFCILISDLSTSNILRSL